MKIDEWTQQVLMDDAILLERRLELWIQPKPRLLPKWLWYKVVGRLLFIKEIR